MLKKHFNGVRPISIVLAMLSVTSLANREDWVGRDGEQTYGVVIEDASSNASTREPGIYIFRRVEGDSVPVLHLLMPGRLAFKEEGLRILPLPSEDTRKPAVGVVDGRVVVFHRLTDMADPETYAVLGSERHRARHVWTDQEVDVPLIQSSEDYELLARRLSSHRTLLMVSLRLPGGVMGAERSGMTFYSVVEDREEGDRSHVQLSEPFRLIDDRFLSGGKLSELVGELEDYDIRKFKFEYDRDSEVFLFSRLALQGLARPMRSDPAFVRVWKEKLREFLEPEKFSAQISIAEEVPPVPYVELSGREVIPEEPMIEFEYGSRHFIRQTYSLVGERPSLLVRLDREVVLYGLLKEGVDGTPRVFDHESATEALFEFNESVYWVSKNEIIELPHGFNLDNATDIAFFKPNDANYLLVSYKRMESAYTVIVFLAENLASVPEVAEINNELYSFEQLEERLVPGVVTEHGATPPLFIIDSFEGRSAESPRVGVELVRGMVGRLYRFADRELSHENLGVRVNLSRDGALQLSVRRLNGETLMPDAHSAYGAPKGSRRFKDSAGNLVFPEDIGMHVIADPRLGSLGRMLIISVKFRDSDGALRGATYYMEISQPPGERPIELGDFKKLSDQFYSSDELMTRTKTTGSSAVFDDLTPEGLVGQEYKAAYDEAGLHRDLLDSGHARYIRPQVDFQLNADLRWVVFGSEGRVGNMSGIYLNPQSRSTSDRETLGTKILALVPLETKVTPPRVGPAKKQQPRYHSALVHGSTMTFGQKKDDEAFKRSVSFSLSVGRNLSQGASIQPILLMIATLTSRETTASPQFTGLTRLDGVDPRDITAADIIWENFSERGFTHSGRSKRAGHIVIAVDSGDEPEHKKVYVRSIEFTYRYGTENSGKDEFSFSETGTARVIAEGERFDSPEELKRRIVQDKLTGRAFWVKEGQVAVNNIDYTLVSLADEAEVLKPFDPNRIEEVRRYTFPWDDIAAQSGRSSVSSLWHIFNERSTRPVIEAVAKSGLDSFGQKSLYPELIELVNRIASGEAPVEHRAIIVPQELKSYVWNLLIARWMLGTEGNDGWSVSNNGLGFYVVQSNDETMRSQPNILMQLDALRLGRVPRRPVVLADLATVREIGIPVPSTEEQRKNVPRAYEMPAPFQIQLELPTTVSSSSTEVVVSSRRFDHKVPSLFYLLRTEGERVSPSQVPDRGLTPKIPMIFVGTEEEYAQVAMRGDAAHPEIARVLRPGFSILRLDYPSEETRVERFIEAVRKAGLVERFSWSAAGLRPGAENLDREAQLAIFARWVVNRVDRLADNNGTGRGKLEYFSDFLNRFVTLTSQDVVLQQSRQIDRRYAERVLVPLFNLPPSVDALPEDDYLVQVTRRENDVILRWQTGVNPRGVRHPIDRGYDGAFDIKREILERIRSQTTSNDAKKVVASFIFVGETGSGKTWLWDSLMYVLGFREISPSALSSTGSDIGNYLRIDCRRFDDGPGESAGPGRMTIKQFNQLMERALLSYHGPRLSILFDDLHEAPETVRAELLRWITRLTDSREIHVGTGREMRAVPTRNILLAITMNPTSDRERIARVAKNQFHPTMEEIIFATLGTKDVKFDESALRRLGVPILIEKFGGSALALIDELGKNALREFEFNNRLTLFMPGVTGMLTRQYSHLDARTFLSELPNALMQFATQASNSFSAPLVVPKSDAEGVIELSYESLLEDRKGSRSNRVSIFGRPEDHSVTSTQLQRFVTDRMEVVDALDPLEGMPYLLRLMLDGFRNRVFESMVSNVQANPEYALPDTGVDIGAMLAAFGGHLIERSMIPFRELQLNLRNFNLRNDAERERLRDRLNEMDMQSRATGQFFPIDFEPRAVSVIKAIMGQDEARPQVDLLRETLNFHTREITSILRRHLSGFLQVEDPDQMPEVREWVRELRAEEYSDYSALGEELMSAFSRFFEEAAERATRVEGAHVFGWYDWVRVYAFLVDRAITRLPWSKATVFVGNVLGEVHNDRSLAELESVMHFFFRSKTTLIRPSTSDVALQMIFGSRAIQEYIRTRGGTGREPFDRDSRLFSSACERVFKK